MQSSSHGEIRTSTAAAARRGPDHEERTDREHVEQHDVLEPAACRRPGARRSRARNSDRGRARAALRAAKRQRGQPRRERRARPAARAPRARSAAARLTGWSRSSSTVAHVVDEVRGARDRAVGDEGCARLQPARRIAELGGEHEAGEDQQVLRPLAAGAAPRDAARSGRATLRQLDDLGRGGHERDSDYSARAGSTSSKRLPALRRALEPDPAAERRGELARDRQAEPGAAAVARPERTEDPLPLAPAGCRGPLSPRRRRRCRRSRSARGRSGRRRASSGRRSRAGSR